MKSIKFAITQKAENYNEKTLTDALTVAQGKIKTSGLTEYEEVNLTLKTGATVVEFVVMPEGETEGES